MIAGIQGPHYGISMAVASLGVLIVSSTTTKAWGAFETERPPFAREPATKDSGKTGEGELNERTADGLPGS
ncbi:MAG TPA: hypothetical protein VMW54_04065 [Terriglobia bacterium]|nr:hypothetical protein [Terriglobia bacterium]